ncbi:MAG: hypothetical protein H6767_06650 [Candidatus Peribacteria bacterium]|nr:MAG: hypothetical protein H6767_06650 [Candidatus Peribacteria bacterium]
MVRSSTALDRQHINGNMAYVRVTGKDGEQIHIRFDLTSNEADTIIDKLSNFKSSSRVATLRSIPGVAEYTPRSRTTSTESARASMLERLHAQYDEAEEFIRRAEMEIYLQTGNEVELQERAMIDDHLRAQTEIDLTNVRTLVSTHLRESYNIKRIREAQDLVREVARNIDRLSDDAITRVSQLLARGNYDTIRTEFNGKAFLKYLRKAVRRAKF